MMKKSSAIIILLCVFFTGRGQVKIVEKNTNTANSFSLASVKLLNDANDALAVKTAIRLFAEDVERVTGERPDITTECPRVQRLIIAGTIEGNKWIRELASNKKINIDSLKGQWERYGIFLVKDPYPHVKQALIIAGSDRRAVAYGLFSISEKIGVSPWYWWADVPVQKQKSVSLSIDNFISVSPSVRYRGIFINDEDWGIRPWAKKTFDSKLDDIGPKTYAKVFELLLRLKANYLCPAMHPGSGAFNKYPENKIIADSFGIVMGSTHPEPLLFNNASEWDNKTMGDWNYLTNKKNILKVLDKRVKENASYENVYTLALRGLHDKEMEGNYSMQERVKLLDDALQDQRNILKKYINKPLSEVPQIFVPYKEVLDIYNAGLKVPDDVTIMWPDDNYGYMKQLSNETERKRSGHSGVYYHASYLGSPHDYLWLASTPPNLMYEELHKAYLTGADRIWLLNSGDIKSCEAPVTQFLNMAYNIDSFNFQNTPDFQAKWLASIYGSEYYDQLKYVTTTYNRLAFSRKPEAMGWGYEWNSNKYPRERPTGTAYSFDNYHEAVSRINNYLAIQEQAKAIYDQLPDAYKPSFYELVLYPITGASLMNRMWLIAQQQKLFYYEKNSMANTLKREVDVIHDSLKIITEGYNHLLDGKWNHVISLVNGVTASYFEKPKLDSIAIPTEGSLNIKTEGTGINAFDNMLPSFDNLINESHYFDLYNTGQQTVQWSAKADVPWIILDKNSGSLDEEDRINVTIDWRKFPGYGKAEGAIKIKTSKEDKQVLVSAFASTLNRDSLKGVFIEHDGVVSIPAYDFQRKSENNDIKMQIIDELGYAGKSVMMGDPVAPIQNPKASNSPNLQYDFYTFHSGLVHVYTYVLPVFPLSSNRDFGFHESSNSQTSYGVSVDDGAVAFPSSSAPEYSQTWSENVLRNAAVNESTLYINKPGRHTLKIICGDAGMIVQKIVIDFGGMKFSYTGPPATIVK